MSTRPRAHIGLDLDNTVILWDRAFHVEAVRRHGMPEGVARDKAAIRAWFWAQPDGNTPWTELQGVVYGTRAEEAEVAPGLPGFLAACAERGVRVSIVSQKTVYPALGPRADLRAAALGFLEARGLLAGPALERGRVHFTVTRAEKAALVGALGCEAFVDDLVDVFAEPAFPAPVVKVLYDRTGESPAPPGLVSLRDWDAIRAFLLP